MGFKGTFENIQQILLVCVFFLFVQDLFLYLFSKAPN